MSSVYQINKGIGREIEFKGLRGQYIGWLAGGLLFLLLLFAGMYLAGLGLFWCMGIEGVLGGGLFIGVSGMNRKFGRYGLMKRLAWRKLPAELRFRSRKVFLALTQAGQLLVEKLLPVYKVEHSAVLSFQGDVTVAFEMELPEIFTLADSEHEAFHQAWLRAVKVLPSHTVLQKQDWYVRTAYKPDQQKASEGFLSAASEDFFAGRKSLSHRCYVLLTKKPNGRRAASSLWSTLMRKSLVPLAPASASEFMDKVSTFAQILSDSGFVTLRRLPDFELSGTAEKPGLIERYCFLAAQDKNPVLRDVKLKDSLNIGGKNCVMFSMADATDMPHYCGSRITYDKYATDQSPFSTGFASGLSELLPCNHLYSQYIFIGDAQKTQKEMESKRLRLQSLSAISRENAMARDATSDFLNEAVASGRLPVKAHFNVLAWADDPAEHKELPNLVSSALAGIGISPKQETVGAPQIWWAGLPGNAADFPMNDTFDTFLEQALCFLNTEAPYRSSPHPLGMRLGDRISGKPVNVNLADEPLSQGIIQNFNRFILGGSGSGKSFFTNHLLRSSFDQGGHVVVVDVGHSYKGLCKAAKGYYFTYDEQNPICFNPFFIGEGDQLDTEKKESLKTLLVTLWKNPKEELKTSEYMTLGNALQEYFQMLSANPDVFPCFNSFYEFLRDEYSVKFENGQIEKAQFDYRDFMYVLQPFYKGGEFDYLLNATSNLDLLNQRFIVFELDLIKDHRVLFPVVTIIIMEVFLSKIRKLPSDARKSILIEEAWKAIAKEGMSEYIRYLFKTVRKFNGEAMVVTQEIEDIISSPVIKQAIINNSDCKILLDQRKYQNNFKIIQELLGLTEKEKTQVLSLNRANDPQRQYREVFISLGAGQLSKVYRTEVSRQEYYCYTTKAEEKQRVAQAELRYGSFERGIAAVVAAERKAKAERKRLLHIH